MTDSRSPRWSDSRLVAGAMSGTSADGVDVAIVEVEGRGLDMKARLVHHHARAYDASLRQAIFAVREKSQTSVAALVQLGRDISLTYATAVNEALTAAGLQAVALAAVAAHGQTLYHAPPDTLQWLDPALLAAAVGCAVVSDFRRADCAAGGQGAPLVPFADYLLFRHPTKTRVLLNIGGIANATFLRAGMGLESVFAFDTGPGNCISDYLCRKYVPTGPGYDVGGRLAARGNVLEGLLRRAICDEYFGRVPPKSTDGPEMIRLFESARWMTHRDEALKLEDLLATACLLTVQTIHRPVIDCTGLPPLRPARGSEVELIVSGGGTRNAYLKRYLGFEFPADLLTTDQVGVPSEAKEAMAFALLGAATLDGEPSNVPGATGARRRVVLGSVTPKP